MDEGGWRFVSPCEGMRLALESGGFATFSEGTWRLPEVHGRLFVDGEQVVGPRVSAIVEPSGGAVVDAEARTAILAVLLAMRTHGLGRIWLKTVTFLQQCRDLCACVETFVSVVSLLLSGRTTLKGD